MTRRQKRSQLANLLFAGGGITAAALVAQYQLHRAPDERVYAPCDGLTGQVSESLRVETPELPTMPCVEKPQITGRDVFVKDPGKEMPHLAGAMAAPRPRVEPEPDDGFIAGEVVAPSFKPEISDPSHRRAPGEIKREHFRK